MINKQIYVNYYYFNQILGLALVENSPIFSMLKFAGGGLTIFGEILDNSLLTWVCCMFRGKNQKQILFFT